MTDIASPEIAVRSTSWRLHPDQIEVGIPYAVIGERPDSLLLTGLGERDVVGIAERLAANGVIELAVASLVYPQISGRLEKRPDVVESSIVNGISALADDIMGSEQPLRLIIGPSEAGSQAILGVFKKPDLAEKVVAIAPGCLDNEALGSGLRQQARELINRFGTAGMLEILQSSDESEKRALIGELRGELAYAATQADSRDVLKAVQDKVTIYIGDEEEIFPYSEAVTSVGEDSITLVQGLRHPVLSTEAGAAAFAAFLSNAEIL